MEDGPPRFPRDYTCPAVLRIPLASFHLRIREFHPLRRTFPGASAGFPTTRCGPTTPHQKPGTVWARPLSLAATDGVSFDFLSAGYLDVSVPRVGSSCEVVRLRVRGFPIRTSPDHRVLARFPELIAGSCVLHRLLQPRHPPCALCSYISTDTLDRSESLMCYHRDPRFRHGSTTTFLYAISKNFQVCDHMGGGERTRTADPLRAKQVLSQLSYAPITSHDAPKDIEVVGPG